MRDKKKIQKKGRKKIQIVVFLKERAHHALGWYSNESRGPWSGESEHVTHVHLTWLHPIWQFPREAVKEVLNLRMVTEGTELHEIMQDCLRIARGDASGKY